jgi:hypothetical protein
LLESSSLSADPPAGADPDTWRTLRHLQLDFASSTGSRERQLVLAEFVARAGGLNRAEPRRLELEQEIALRLGLGHRARDSDPAVDAAIRRRWRRWLRIHGDDFEAGRPCPEPPPLRKDSTLSVLARDRARAAAPRKPRRRALTTSRG